MDTQTPEDFRSGFVAIVGRPNVGKSTLLNRILGEKIVITSDKPQTTRNSIRGIHNVPNGQIVFIDTPGIHNARSRLNRYMMETAQASLKEVDVVLFLAEASSPLTDVERNLLATLKERGLPVLLALTKADVTPPELLAKRRDELTALMPFDAVFTISALKGEGVEPLVERVRELLPEGPQYFPDDILTDVPERFVAAEIIREKIFRLTRDEVPYAVAVEVISFKERDNGLIAISAVITVERDTQKGIVIGRKGDMLKKIGMQARRELEDLLQTKVFLELFVRVRKDWTEDPRMLKELGYS